MSDENSISISHTQFQKTLASLKWVHGKLPAAVQSSGAVADAAATASAAPSPAAPESLTALAARARLAGDEATAIGELLAGSIKDLAAWQAGVTGIDSTAACEVKGA